MKHFKITNYFKRNYHYRHLKLGKSIFEMIKFSFIAQELEILAFVIPNHFLIVFIQNTFCITYVGSDYFCVLY